MRIPESITKGNVLHRIKLPSHHCRIDSSHSKQSDAKHVNNLSNSNNLLIENVF